MVCHDFCLFVCFFLYLLLGFWVPEKRSSSFSGFSDITPSSEDPGCIVQNKLCVQCRVINRCIVRPEKIQQCECIITWYIPLPSEAMYILLANLASNEHCSITKSYTSQQCGSVSLFAHTMC